jgi:hypothetical protein
MARGEAHREDLWAEAVALTRRVELRVPEMAEPVVAGLRDDGRLSVYFGGDPVYHFDSQGRLWRAFVADRLYRRQGNTLTRLTRIREQTETVLARYDLSSEEYLVFVAEMHKRLAALSGQVEAESVVIRRQYPEGTSIVPAIGRALSALLRN